MSGKGKKTTGRDLAESIRSRFAEFGGVELPDFKREAVRDPEIFDEAPEGDTGNRNRVLWRTHERIVKSGIQLKDAFGKLKD
jgi:hypothetical protein